MLNFYPKINHYGISVNHRFIQNTLYIPYPSFIKYAKASSDK
jgi:hypothetical protein